MELSLEHGLVGVCWTEALGKEVVCFYLYMQQSLTFICSKTPYLSMYDLLNLRRESTAVYGKQQSFPLRSGMR